MNQKIFLSICLLALGLIGCQNATVDLKPNLVIKSEKLDFGTIRSMDTIWQEVLVENSGTAPLIIDDINVSCGCTIPKWSETPILPGEKQTMEIGLVPETVGQGEKHRNSPFKKSIVIRSNAAEIFTSLQIVGILDNIDS